MHHAVTFKLWPLRFSVGSKVIRNNYVDARLGLNGPTCGSSVGEDHGCVQAGVQLIPHCVGGLTVACSRHTPASQDYCAVEPPVCQQIAGLYVTCMNCSIGQKAHQRRVNLPEVRFG